MNNNAFRGLTVLAVFSVCTSVLAEDGPDWAGNWELVDDGGGDPDSNGNADDGGRNGRVLRGVLRGVSIFGIPVGNLPVPRRGSSGDGSARGKMADAEYLTSRVEALEVLQGANETEIIYDDARVVSYQHGDARVDDGAIVEADWDGRDFVVEHRFVDDTDVIETYRISDDGRRLLWIVRIEAKRAKPVEFTRTYERPDGGGLRFAS